MASLSLESIQVTSLAGWFQGNQTPYMGVLKRVKRQEVEAASFLRLGPGNFYCSLLVKPSRSADSRAGEGGDRSHILFFFFLVDV